MGKEKTTKKKIRLRWERKGDEKEEKRRERKRECVKFLS